MEISLIPVDSLPTGLLLPREMVAYVVGSFSLRGQWYLTGLPTEDKWSEARRQCAPDSTGEPTVSILPICFR
jgi:hypothetical protein